MIHLSGNQIVQHANRNTLLNYPIRWDWFRVVHIVKHSIAYPKPKDSKHIIKLSYKMGLVYPVDHKGIGYLLINQNILKKLEITKGIKQMGNKPNRGSY